ncbi:pyridoxal-phosphate dependent enzyme [Flavobacteriaceae bacterium]|nr:pyridoxal-phosphate dependent enzyme [Flavobacteriaceae bacterium]MDA9284769.1 pyridoxal-phosphate dependent enzyme [Flavobacteriaceae bacterium]MDC0552372.1 pyridoxal-phosphate dependent enzyme [Flavobacteriaceae bacterium]|tara:strand:+ start:175 stop:1089 length:915 start_codon:yes stop_codon:yes gene_type:complete
MDVILKNSINEKVHFVNNSGLQLFLKREDKIHNIISGNKYRKLKFNLINAKELGFKGLLTFGGAYSNHIPAVAYAAKKNGFKSLGFIRGEEIVNNYLENPTLKYSHDLGMKFKFLSRSNYKLKTNEYFLRKLKKKFKDYYLIPEGGTNALGVLGCQEILNDNDKEFDYICCSVGTGGTICGLINSSNENQKIIGFSSINKNYLLNDITKFVTNENWMLIDDFSFGGYGKVNNELIEFMNNFRLKYGILLDPIYTSKLVYGVLNLITNNFFKPNSKILMIHTGGHQGIFPMNKFLKNKNLTTINY